MERVFGRILLAILILLASCQQNTMLSKHKIKNAICGVEESYSYGSYLDKIIKIQQKYPIKTRRLLTFSVKVYFVSSSQKSDFFQADLEQAFYTLNKAFKPLHIQFQQEDKLTYIEEKYSVDELYKSRALEQQLTQHFYNPQVINLYVFQEYQNVVGFTHYPILNINRLFIAQDKLNDSSLLHEMGHFFGLLHTFEQSVSMAEKINDPYCVRNGDKICDTPADPVGASFLETECTLYGTYKDSEGHLFIPDLSNYMSYYGSCRNKFTSEQAERIYYIALYVKWQQMKMLV